MVDSYLEAYNIPYLHLIICAVVLAAVEASSQRTARNTGQPGHVYLEELLGSHPTRIYDVLRMQRGTFLELCDWLEQNTSLQPSRSVSVQEQVAMFLWTVNYSASSRQVIERFQHSPETVSR